MITNGRYLCHLMAIEDLEAMQKPLEKFDELTLTNLKQEVKVFETMYPDQVELLRKRAKEPQ